MRKVPSSPPDSKPKTEKPRRPTKDEPIPYALTQLGESAADPHGDRLGWDEEP